MLGIVLAVDKFHDDGGYIFLQKSNIEKARSREGLSGIYKIQNQVNSKCYIGSAVNITNRLRNHKKELIADKHGNEKLQRAWNKYGVENFEFVAIRKCSTDKLLPFEQIVINRFDSVENGYNIAPIAGSPMKDRKHALKTKRKMSADRKGRISPMKGKYHSPETKIKIGDAVRGEKHPMFGKHWSEAIKEKQRVSHLGQVAWNKGIPHPKEQCERISDSCKGRIPWNKDKHWPDAIKIKISDSCKSKIPWNKGLGCVC